MSETPGAPSGRAALELGIAQLSKLRNQTGPTIAFKKWRKTLIDAINELWPEDRTKSSRFLRSPPVFSVRGASGSPRNDPDKQELSPTALAIMAMAVEIESMGVPEGDRPRVREALLDLARKLDSSKLSWRQLRITMEVVM